MGAELIAEVSLSAGIHFSHPLLALELGAVGIDGLQLPLQLPGDVHDERRLRRVLPIRHGVDHFPRAELLPRNRGLGETGHEARVVGQLARDPVIGVSRLVPHEDDGARA